MSRSFIRCALRGATLAGLLLVALSLGGGTALAYHEISRTGVVGAYSWVDTTAHPGGRCAYNKAMGQGLLDTMSVKAPIAYWPLGSSVSHGTIGYRIKLQHYNGTTWLTVGSSGEVTAVAWKHAAAALARRTVTYTGSDWSRKFRALAVLTWYRADSTVLGRASVTMSHYWDDFHQDVRAACPGNPHRIEP